MSKKYMEPPAGGGEPGSPVQSGPFNKSAPLRGSFGVYLISLIVVALVVFVVMLVQYLPGYRAYSRIKVAV